MSARAAGFALFLAIAGLLGFRVAAHADALVTQGIGTSSCATLASDPKPAECLNNPVNLMMYAWAQVYLSAANISLLEDDAKHVDLSGLDEGKVLSMVVNFCKANPDKKPVSAIDDFIRKADKAKAKWEPGTINWANEPVAR
jgi:hypothetical protein